MSTFNYRQEVEAKKSTKSNVEQVVSVPATIDRPPGFESRPGGLPTLWSEGRQITLKYCKNNVT